MTPMGARSPSRSSRSVLPELNLGLAERHQGRPSQRDRADVRQPASSSEGARAHILRSSHPPSRHRSPLLEARHTAGRREPNAGLQSIARFGFTKPRTSKNRWGRGGSDEDRTRTLCGSALASCTPSASAKPTDQTLQPQLVAALSAAQTAAIFSGESIVIRSIRYPLATVSV